MRPPDFPADIIHKLNIVKDFKEAVQQIEEARVNNPGRPLIVSFINTHAFNIMYTDDEFYQAMRVSDFIFRDGKGIEILLKSLGKNPGKNLCGTDFIPYLMEQNKEASLGLYGTDDTCINTATEYLQSENFKVNSSANGFLPETEYLQKARKDQPSLIILGMGMPKQEKVAANLKSTLAYGAIIVNGGAIIDHLGKKVTRAPKWIRSMGAEWVYRLVTEPRRLFKRYVIGNWVFLSRINGIKRKMNLQAT